MNKILRNYQAGSSDLTAPLVLSHFKDDIVKQELAVATNNQKWIAHAPLVIVAVADLVARGEGFAGMYIDEDSGLFDVKLTVRDTAIAVTHLLLEVDNQGLGACWCGAFKQKDVRPVLDSWR